MKSMAGNPPTAWSRCCIRTCRSGRLGAHGADPPRLQHPYPANQRPAGAPRSRRHIAGAAAQDERAPDSHAESLIFVEIDRCASASALRELEQSLLGVLADVRQVVGDFAAMKAR